MGRTRGSPTWPARSWWRWRMNERPLPDGGGARAGARRIYPQRSAPGAAGYSPCAAGFAAGGSLDLLTPDPVLAGFAQDAVDAGLGLISDDELVGLLCAARRLSSWQPPTPCLAWLAGFLPACRHGGALVALARQLPESAGKRSALDLRKFIAGTPAFGGCPPAPRRGDA